MGSPKAVATHLAMLTPLLDRRVDLHASRLLRPRHECAAGRRPCCGELCENCRHRVRPEVWGREGRRSREHP